MKMSMLQAGIILAVLATEHLRRAEIHLRRDGQDDGQVLL